jgi:hypothetical protein
MPEPRIPEPAPELPLIDGKSLPSIEIVELVTDIPGGRILGWHYEGEDYRRAHDYRWDESFRNRTELMNLHTVKVMEEAGYELSLSDPDRVRLTAVMRKVTYNSYARKIRFNQAECEVRWQLFRMGEEKPYATVVSTGEARADDIQAGAVVSAYDVALRRLLAGDEFAAALAER